MQLEFLGWDRPLLESTANYLLERFSESGTLDLRNVVLAFPGRRGIGRLEEILVERVEKLAAEGKIDPAWFPPEYQTLGGLPEVFYPLKRPLADNLTQQLAWNAAVQKLETDFPDLLARLLPHPPNPDDLEARLALGRLFSNLHRTLAENILDFKDIEKLCNTMKLPGESIRWKALAELQRLYLEQLDSLELWDVQTARRFAIQYRELETDKTIVLVGMVDMNRTQEKIFEALGNRVTALVFAPKSAEHLFDDNGCLDPDQWAGVEIPMRGDQIRVVERPPEQADAVLGFLSSLNGKYAANQIVIGVPDMEVIPFIEQRLHQAGAEARHFEGLPVKQSAVFRFLEAIQRFLETKTFRSYAELMRHPDVEKRMFDKKQKDQFVDILSELDRYHTEFLPFSVDENWRDLVDEDNAWRNHSFEPLRQLWANMTEMIGDACLSPEKRSLTFWTEELTAMLQRLYGDKGDRFVKEGRRLFGDAVAQVNDIPEELLPTASATEAIELILSLLRTANIPPPDERDAIEMVGWLDLAMDDAPVMIVSGMNDGFVPSFVTADAFLPDKIRTRLNIEDNRRRFARDAYALTMILETRKSTPELVRLVGGKKSVQGDPLLPSRLFFAADDHTVAERVKNFFGTTEPNKERADISKQKQRADHGFVVPTPIPLDPQPKTMSVTEFGAYVQCPYRYYLQYRLRLNELNDDEEELNASTFGELIHHVLSCFGKSHAKDSRQRETIQNVLDTELDLAVQKLYGNSPRPVVQIQAEQARLRLRAFAGWQADWAAKGNVIQETEIAFDEKAFGGKIFLDVDGRKMFLRGRIDRIDFNPERGEYTVFDYKTSDTALEPKKKHLKKGEWVDFQLPLYRYILEQAGYPSTINLGYIALPKDVDKTGALLADWTLEELDGAEDEAREIVRKIWNNEFPKTDPPPPYSEKFAVICLDPIRKRP